MKTESDFIKIAMSHGLESEVMSRATLIMQFNPFLSLRDALEMSLRDHRIMISKENMEVINKSDLERIVIKCHSRELAEQVILKIKNIGFSWGNPEDTDTIDSWAHFKENTIYEIQRGNLVVGDIRLGQSGKKSVQAEDFLKKIESLTSEKF